MDVDPVADKEYLCFGDEIALQLLPEDATLSPHTGYVTVQFGSSAVSLDYLESNISGNGADTNMLSNPIAPLYPRRVMLTVCPPLRFDGAAQFDAAFAERGQWSDKELGKLRANATLEEKANEEDNKRLQGQRVRYGQKITLYHDLSARTICFSESPGVRTYSHRLDFSSAVSRD
jgi:hypothetical protein